MRSRAIPPTVFRCVHWQRTKTSLSSPSGARTIRSGCARRRLLYETREAIPGQVPRILHMGGSSTLLTTQGSHCFDLPDFPQAYRGPALGQAQALDYYRGDTNGRVSWTYLSSPPVYFAPGKRTGKDGIGVDHPVEDA